eukprot:1788584-Prymnesium_polylepis.1
MRPRGGAHESHYTRVTYLHVGGSTGGATTEIGRDAMEALTELLAADACALTALDLSGAEVDGWDLIQALRANSSLTALDVRAVPRMVDLYDTLASTLLEPLKGGERPPCRIGFVRCDSFELLEGEPALSLAETALDPAAGRLLAGALRHNTTLVSLDLSAADLHRDVAADIVTALASNSTLATLRLPYNPSLDDATKATLTAAAEAREAPLTLEL